MRMPIKKTTKSPSICAAMRCGITLAMLVSLKPAGLLPDCCEV
jgi:hypothetical protein